jgi:hypothetical protein
MLRSKHPRNRVSIAYCNTDEIRNKKKGKYKMTMIILDTIVRFIPVALIAYIILKKYKNKGDKKLMDNCAVHTGGINRNNIINPIGRLSVCHLGIHKT